MARKLKKTNGDQSKKTTQMVTTEKHILWQNLKTKILTKLKN